MQLKLDASFSIKQKEKLTEELGINPGGRVQKVIDASTIHYLRLLMPQDSGIMMANTRNPKPGLVTVETPYAHYQNEGILYVMPKNGKGAFHDPISGRYWSKKGEKKIPSNKKLQYHGGPNRGAHFVERTITEHFDDILNNAKKEVRK